MPRVLQAVFRIAIEFLPPNIADTYGREMRYAFAAELDRRLGERGVSAGVWYAVSAIGDVVRQGIKERLFRGGSQSHNADGSRLTWHRSVSHELGLDIRLAVRSLRRSPGFAVSVLVVLAMGIGANTAVFSVIDAVLLEALPYAQPDRLVTVGHIRGGANVRRLPSSTGMQEVYSTYATSFQSIALFRNQAVNLSGVAPSQRIIVAEVTPTLFDVLAAAAIHGRVFTKNEGRPEAADVAVISHGFWVDQYGHDPEILSKTVRVDGIVRQVVGVMEPDFAFPDRGERMWIPLTIDPVSSDFGGFNYQSIGRLNSDATLESAALELQSLFPILSERYPYLSPDYIETSELLPDVHPYIDDVIGGVRAPLWFLMATVGLVLCIACANLANLFLVRAELRRREIAVRTAVGAGRARLMLGFMVESALIVVTGAVLGVLLAYFGLDALKLAAGNDIPRLDTVGVNTSVLWFTGVVVSVITLIFGAIPVLRHRGFRTAEVLRDETRAHRGSLAGNRARNLLVVSQVALALVLLVGSALMAGSYAKLNAVDPGFRAESVLTFRIPLPEADYRTWDAAAAFHRELLDRLNGLHEVAVAGAATALPLSGRRALNPISVEGRVYESGTLPPIIESRAVTPGYFQALGIPLLRGRMLERADAASRTGAVLLSKAVADIVFLNEEAIGRSVAHSMPDPHDGWSTVVGVVGDVHSSSLAQDPMGILYFAINPGEGVQKGWLAQSMSYAVKTNVPPMSLVPTVREMVQELDQAVPVADVRSMEEIEHAAQAELAFSLWMICVAAGVGLILAAVGIYGVVSYSTAQRTREVGVRLALGADGIAVQWMVIKQGMGVTVAGLAVGTLAAHYLSRFIEALLFGVEARNPLVFGSVVAFLAAVSLIATWIPASRAARVDPVDALRAE